MTIWESGNKLFLFPTPLVLALFLAAASLLLYSFFKCFFGLVYVIFLQYIANVTQRTFEIVPKNRDHANNYNYIIISIIKNVERASTARASPEISTCEVPNDI